MHNRMDDNKREAIVAQWDIVNGGKSMWPSQETLLNAFLMWEANITENRISVLWLYMGEMMGHTTLWKMLKHQYPNQYLLMAQTLQLGDRQGFTDKLALSVPINQFNLIQNPKTQILIIDVGGPFIVSHDQLVQYSSIFKGVVVA